MNEITFSNDSQIEVESVEIEWEGGDGGGGGGYMQTCDADSGNVGDSDDAIAYYTGSTTYEIGGADRYTSVSWNKKDSRIEDLKEIGGVGESKAEVLYEAGYETIESIRNATQSELAELESIGNALAARIKADVGGMEVKERNDLIETDVKAEELVQELKETMGEDTDEVKFLEQETLMYGME